MTINLIFSVILISGAVFYVNFIIWLLKGLKRIKAVEPLPKTELPYVTVIVPARNEEGNLEDTLDSLADMDYPQEKYQVVMVDDRSEDNTYEIMTDYAKRHSNFTAVKIDTIPPGISPKKNAIEWGIAASTGEIIVTTDADCLHHREWLKQMAAYFTPEVGITAGLTIFDPDNETIFHRLHSIDYFSHSLIAAGAIGNGEGMNCNGSNLAYRYETYMKLGGYGRKAGMVSGDDEFLLQRMLNSKLGEARFSISPETIVHSLPPAKLKGIMNQRFRWGSKGLYYPPEIKRRAVIIFIYLLTLMISPLLALAGWMPSAVFLSAAGAKILADYTIMRAGGRIFSQKIPIIRFILLSLIHPLLTTFTAAGGHLLPFEWKGKKYRSKLD
ncbi:glycosyltransferase [bacterium]|nr:glycosyltransferase [bacterium]